MLALGIGIVENEHLFIDITNLLLYNMYTPTNKYIYIYILSLKYHVYKSSTPMGCAVNINGGDRGGYIGPRAESMPWIHITIRKHNIWCAYIQTTYEFH